jgi:hypothetical protein
MNFKLICLILPTENMFNKFFYIKIIKQIRLKQLIIFNFTQQSKKYKNIILLKIINFIKTN